MRSGPAVASAPTGPALQPGRGCAGRTPIVASANLRVWKQSQRPSHPALSPRRSNRTAEVVARQEDRQGDGRLAPGRLDSAGSERDSSSRVLALGDRAAAEAGVTAAVRPPGSCQAGYRQPASGRSPTSASSVVPGRRDQSVILDRAFVVVLVARQQAQRRTLSYTHAALKMPKPARCGPYKCFRLGSRAPFVVKVPKDIK